MSTIDSQTNQVFNYKLNAFMDIPYRSDVSCEDVCIFCCKSLNILPTARLLFGLRVCDTENWLTLCRPLKPPVKYEFRMRFKVPELDTLYKIDANAYEYLYVQIRHDLVSDRISDIRYPTFKDNVVGLGVVDMYIDFLEQKGSIESLENNYKHYLPKQLVKTHKMFARKKICEGFQAIRKKNHELTYVKRTYMNTITGLSPNYLMVNFNAMVEKLPEDNANNGPHPVTVKLDAFDPDGPSIKVSLKYKEEWLVVTKLENICAVYREGKKCVNLDIRGWARYYRLEFARPCEVKTFMSYVSGYFRLMIKWTFDPCVDFVTPSLQELETFRCHGPVGGDFSYAKIREKEGKCGSYILRQCEREYDVYYIDINTKGTQTETFKITRDRDKWQLHMNDSVRCFNKPTDLALGIPTASENKFRIPPSLNDKPPLLLLCLPRNLLPKKTDNEISEAQLQRQRVQIFDPKEDLQWYTNSERECDGGRMNRIQADWIQPKDVKDVEVTLKVLKSESDFTEFMKLANTWSRMPPSEFIKLYGLTLQTPYTMIMEKAKFGPLGEFLYNLKEKVPLECLLDAVHGLVVGIGYLQEKELIHGYIRCNYLMVTKFDPKKHILVSKISDPGLPKSYTPQDLPWISFEHHKNFNAAKTDKCADLWAFATTVWEIFSRGKPINNLTVEILAQNYNRYGGILPKPFECSEEIYQIMMDGWSLDRDRRFNQQVILKLLNSRKQNLFSNNYASIENGDQMSDRSSITSSCSNTTEDTFQTLLNGNSGSDVRSANFSANSTSCERIPLIRSHNHNPMSQFNSNYFEDTPSVFMISNGKIISKEKIGQGHYGTVYRGEIHFHNNRNPEQVAIKTFKGNNMRFSQDFIREISIMKTLDHPNIVKIIMSVDTSIIMEYVQGGSFIVHLSVMRPNLTNKELLDFALDIAMGMEYLRSKKVIHRDLAARNILIDGKKAKISDFGLAQVANNDGYYFAQSDREIPIKWYAPESIKTGKFSFQSDVWSYGVTLFEIFSRGEIPNLYAHTELPPVDFLNRLESGQRLPKPDRCPDNVYDKLMMPCWHENPKARPEFKAIVDSVQSIINESGECI